MAEHKHIPTLDGLRAVAILLVLLHMGGLRPTIDNQHMLGSFLAILMDSGWIGVQLFFVLSGFLITTILLKTNNRDTFKTLLNFYIRRALRIFPLYYSSLAILFTLAITLNEAPEWLKNSFLHKWHFIFYLSNWITPFIDPFMGHFWSLAVEEQFYFIWPILVLLINRNKLIWLCIILIIQAPIFRICIHLWQNPHIELVEYTWTPARLDGLLIGALLAILRLNPNTTKRLHFFISVSSVLSLIYVIASIKTHYLFQPTNNDWTVLNQSIIAVLFAGFIHFCLADC